MARAAASPRRRSGARVRRRNGPDPSRRLPRLTRLPARGGAGLALILLAIGLIFWLLASGPALDALRTPLVEAVGIGAFSISGALILGGFWLLSGAPVPGRTTARRLGGALLCMLSLLGLSGLSHPDVVLSGVRLDRVSAGGDAGDFLASPVGTLPLLALGLSASLLIAPRSTWRVLTALWRSRGRVSRLPRLRPLLSQLLARRHGRPADPWAEPTPPAFPAAAPDPAIDEHSLALATATALGGAAAVAEPSAPAPARSPAAAPPPPPATGGQKRRRSADGWRLPPLTLLQPDPSSGGRSNSREQAQLIVDTLASFGVDARVTQIKEGPSVTQFGIEPGWEIKTRLVPVRDEQGKAVVDKYGQTVLREEELSRTRVRVNRITRLVNDIALSLAAPSIRMEAPVPGQSVVGLEVPSQDRRVVTLRGIIESEEFQHALRSATLPVALGRNVAGQAVVMDLARMPHLLIAGATGSGKSVCINSIIACLLMHFSPDTLRLVLVDPKRVELTGYGKVPHLAFSHVITDMDEVVRVLSVVVTEMERRYRRLEIDGVRNIQAYNAKERPEGPLPYWVVIIDELADLMLAAPVEVEQQLVRLAQLARATGIHLILATQRPSVDVVTGLIKANFPTRIAFAATSQTDSRVIMDRAGAEKLLGRGDMLFQATDRVSSSRVQGTYVSDAEIEGLINFWTQERFTEVVRPTFDHLLQEAHGGRHPAAAAPGETGGGPPPDAASGQDALYPQAYALATDHTRVSTSLLQRRLRIGYPRAARLIDALEAAGVVAPSEDGQSRRVLIRTDSAGL